MTRYEMASISAAVLVGCGGGAAASETTETTADEPAEAPSGPSIVVTPEMGHPHPGDEAPDFELTDQEGNPVRLSSLRGSVVVLAFSASWCPFSRAEQPNLAQLARDYADQNVKVLVVNIEEEDEGYQTYLGRHEMPMPVLRDATAQVVGGYIPPQAQPNITSDRWKVLVSSNLIIDPEGIIRYFTLVDTAHFDAELTHLRAAVDELLAAQTGT